MPLYIADYLAGTSHLNTVQHGAYLLLIMHYWAKGGLPEDEDSIRQVTRLDARSWNKNRDIVKAFFHDGWKHARLDKELAQAFAISKANSANARKSHEHRRRAAGSPQRNGTTQSQSQSHTQDAASTEAASAAPPAKSIFSDGDFELTNRILKAQGLTEHDLSAVGTTYFAKKWVDQGWQPDLIVATIQAVMGKRDKAPGSLKYFEGAIADAHAELTRPLPEGSTGPPRRTKRTYADITRELEEQIYGPKSDAGPTAATVIDG